MASCPRSVVVLSIIWLMVVAAASPVRRSPDLEARRRSAIDRSMIRFGRSYPPEASAADIREAFQRPTRRGNSFLRFGKSDPEILTAEDLITLLKTYEEDEPMAKRIDFVRLGRDPKFIRLGRSTEEQPTYEQGSEKGNGFPQRIGRARDHFVRFGRDSDEILGEEEIEERRKRSVKCHDCFS